MLKDDWHEEIENEEEENKEKKEFVSEICKMDQEESQILASSFDIEERR